MLNEIEKWIDATNEKYASQRQSCLLLADAFDGFYSRLFLKDCYFVVVDEIPKPDFPQIREMGGGDFLDMRLHGITYKNTYYILKSEANNLRLHFHELVHVAQWKALGAAGFLQRYIHEIQQYGHDKAPLEEIAYRMDAYYANGGDKVNVPAILA